MAFLASVHTMISTDASVIATLTCAIILLPLLTPCTELGCPVGSVDLRAAYREADRRGTLEEYVPAIDKAHNLPITLNRRPHTGTNDLL